MYCIGVVAFLFFLSQKCHGTTSVTVDWDHVVRTSETTTTCQVVVMPPLTRVSYVHDIAWQAFKALNATQVRFAPWFPYPRLVLGQLTPPSGKAKCGHLEGNWNNGDWNLTLKCPMNYRIGPIDFASWGTPTGGCGDFKKGSCHAASSVDVVQKLCTGKQSCVVRSVKETFGSDPCPSSQKRLSIQTSCVSVSDPNLVYSNANWDFTQLDELVEDFMMNGGSDDPWMSFMAFPSWKYDINGTALYGAMFDSPYVATFGYEIGKTLRDPTGRSVADYYSKLIAHYTRGGFTDEYGYQHQSNLFYKFNNYEILNEPEAEHENSPESYTILYDQIVSAIQSQYPVEERNNLKFMGMALQFHKEWNWYNYFLNHSNHITGTPIDYISFHNYAKVGYPSDPHIYERLFPEVDVFVEEVTEILSIRDRLSPNTKTAINEIGILPSDAVCDSQTKNCKTKFGNTWPPNPLDYLSGAAYFAYIFGRLAPLGVNLLGVSEFMGAYETKNFPSPGGINSNWPSGTMVDMFTGVPNARYWGLKLLIDHFSPGDSLMRTSVSNSTNVFALGVMSGGTRERKMLLVNKLNKVNSVHLGGSTNAMGKVFYVDDNNGIKAKTSVINTLTLNPFAIVVVYPPMDDVAR